MLWLDCFVDSANETPKCVDSSCSYRIRIFASRYSACAESHVTIAYRCYPICSEQHGTGIGLWYDVKNPQVRHGRGFTIIEVMIGMVMLLVVITSIFAVVPATVGFGSESEIRMQAVGAAQDYLDVIRQYIKTNGVDTNLPQAPVIPIEPGAGPFSGLA